VKNYSRGANRLRELRDLARVTLHDAATVIGVSYTTVWKAENGYSKLSERQIELLEAFYAPKLAERLKRISRSLGAQQ